MNNHNTLALVARELDVSPVYLADVCTRHGLTDRMPCDDNTARAAAEILHRHAGVLSALDPKVARGLRALADHLQRKNPTHAC